MLQIDTDKIKMMTGNKIAYTLYERRLNMKKKKLKKVMFSMVTCLVLLGGVKTVDALTEGKISNTVKDTIRVFFIGEDNQQQEMIGEQYVDENGDIWVKFKDQSENKVDVNDSELEKEGLQSNTEIDKSSDEINTDIKDNQTK
ncbi:MULTISPECIES: hypothetical protein [unclassified Thomasclavelia]|uniref:hypothetical protein n=1 Tax=unclassified Thomasclavelia TaxID=3025756 RepID=UPI000B36A1F2|nr:MULTISPECIES: hypothetical protein [unclassified Thomasclavelia]OUP78400.1 hypothetical protein B5F09_02995 [Erysipelatoclostridium sp. An173]OUQ07183.1 hypothetical protein B5E92_09155 [Erysipelatoclostridium sp. An15]